MNSDAGDMARVIQPQMRPAFPCIGRLIEAIAVGNVAANAAFTHTDVDDVGVTVGDSHCADRRGVQIGIRDILPVGAGVGGFPDTAGAGTEVRYRGIYWITGHGHDAPAAVWTDTAPF